MSFLIARHSPVWITNDSIHCSLPSNYQNLQKVGYDIVVFNGNVLSHAWHTWCENGTNGKRMSCSLITGHMQIFKLIDFRTMGLEYGLPFFLIRTVYEPHRSSWDFSLNRVQIPESIINHYKWHLNSKMLYAILLNRLDVFEIVCMRAWVCVDRYIL